MASSATQHYWAGFLTGAGLALFALYVLSQAVPITLEQWPRIAVGAIGLALLAVGIVTGLRLPKPPIGPNAW